MEDVIDTILDQVISTAGFQDYYQACNTNLSLAQLLKSSKKNFPSFACEDLKRKYSIPTTVTKKLKLNEDKENLQTIKERSTYSGISHSVIKLQTCCICSTNITANIKRLMCRHTAHSDCLQKYFRSSSGCPTCKIEASLNIPTKPNPQQTSP